MHPTAINVGPFHSFLHHPIALDNGLLKEYNQENGISHLQKKDWNREEITFGRYQRPQHWDYQGLEWEVAVEGMY